MKRSIRLMSIVFLTLLLVACGGKYDDVESTLSDYADAMEDYVARLETADSADAVTQAMKDFTHTIKALTPRLQEIYQQFPEPGGQRLDCMTPRLQEIYQQFPELASGRDYPEELEKISRRMENMAEKVQAAMMKTMQYMMDPDVQKAMTEQAQAMAQTGAGR